MIGGCTNWFRPRAAPSATIRSRRSNIASIGTISSDPITAGSPRLARIRMMLGGRFRDWNATNIAALRRLPPHLITPENRKTLELFAAARTAPLAKRLVYLRQSGVYRQTLLGNLGLLAAAVMKRI